MHYHPSSFPYCMAKECIQIAQRHSLGLKQTKQSKKRESNMKVYMRQSMNPAMVCVTIALASGKLGNESLFGQITGLKPDV